MTTITISMPESSMAFIEEQAVRDGFGTVGEYLCSLIGQAQQRRSQECLETLLLEGLQSGVSELTNEDWSDGRHELLKRHRAKEPDSEE